MTGFPTRRPRFTEWTKDEDDLLTSWWKEGATALAIGNRLHRTRNSIMGRVHRLKLHGEGGQRPPRKPRAKETRKPQPLPPPVVAVQAEPVVVATYSPIPIQALRAWHCRSIVSEHGASDGLALYCGVPKAGVAFCSYHQSLYYAPAKPRAQRG